jgi:hypothetical protein
MMASLPYKDFKTFLLFSVTSSQIWLSLLVEDLVSTYLVKLEKQNLLLRIMETTGPAAHLQVEIRGCTLFQV